MSSVEATEPMGLKSAIEFLQNLRNEVKPAEAGDDQERGSEEEVIIIVHRP